MKTKRETAPQPEANPVNPRIRAYGRARIDFAQRIHSQEDWDAMWKPPAHFFPFAFPGNEAWRFSLEYRVVEYAAEIGFWIDLLGFEVLAIGPEYAQFTPPGGGFAFAVVLASEGQAPTPPESFRLQFQVEHLLETIQELEMRNVHFEQPATPVTPDSPYYLASFRTPNGILVDLGGEVKRVRKETPVEPVVRPAPTLPPVAASPAPKPQVVEPPVEKPPLDWKPARPVRLEKHEIAQEQASSSSYWSFAPDEEDVPQESPRQPQPPARSAPEALEPEPAEDEITEPGMDEIEFEDEITYESLEEEADDGDAAPPKPSGKPHYYNRN